MRQADRLREKADIELREELEGLRKEAFRRRYRSGSDETEERGKVRKLRREIARLLTVIRERALGLERKVKAPPRPEKKRAEADTVEADSSAEAQSAKAEARSAKAEGGEA